jgi:hypothetical protein
MPFFSLFNCNCSWYIFYIPSHFTFFFSLSFFLSVYLLFYLSFSLFLSVSPSLSLSISFYVLPLFYLILPLSLSSLVNVLGIHSTFFHNLSLPPSLSPSHTHSLSLTLFFSLSSLSLSLSLSSTQYFIKTSYSFSPNYLSI